MAAPFSRGPRGDAPALPRVDTSGFMLAEGSQIPGFPQPEIRELLSRNPKPGPWKPNPGTRNRKPESGILKPES